MPPNHVHYVEPFAGGLSVLLAKDPEGVSEVVNDAFGELTNFWRVLADPVWFDDFRRAVEATPFSEYAWQSAARLDPDNCASAVTRAVAFFVLCRQSLAGRMTAFTGVTKTRTRRAMNNEVSAWLSAVDGLPAVHARLKRVLVLNRDALDVIRGHDGPRTLFYCDPPYVHSTRATTGDYAHEMSDDAHAALLAALAACEGKVMLSGYRSALYDRELTESRGWRRHDFDVPNRASKSQRRVTECLWTNWG